MSWIKVLPEAELPEGARRVVKVAGQEVLLLRHAGQVHAVDNRCPHMGGALEKGRLTEDGDLICPLHHSAFDLRTGAVKDWAPWPPGVGRVLGAVRRERPLPIFTARVEDGSVWIEVEAVD